MDWTNQPAAFIAPTIDPAQGARWGAAWDEAFKMMIEIVSDDEKENVRGLVVSEVPHEAPRGWAIQIEEAFKRQWSRGMPTELRLGSVADRFHTAVGLLREEAERDPNFFPSPIGQALVQVFNGAMLYSVGEASMGCSVDQPMGKVVWPTLWSILRNLDALTLPDVARQFGTVPFEVWANRFRRSVSQALEGWYRPMVSAFYRLSRLPIDGSIPRDVSLIGQLFNESRNHWGSGSPLSSLVEPRIAVFRNSEAHNNTDLDVRSEMFTFVNKNPKGVETARWSASLTDFQRLGVHVHHLGELMRTVLIVCIFRCVGRDAFVEVLKSLWGAPSAPS